MSIIYHIEEDSLDALRERIVRDWGKDLIRGVQQATQVPAQPPQAPIATLPPQPAPEAPAATVEAPKATRVRKPKDQPAADGAVAAAEIAAGVAAQAAAEAAIAAEAAAEAAAAAAVPAGAASAPAVRAAATDLPADPTADQVRDVMSKVIAKHDAKLGAVRIFLDQHAAGAKNVTSIPTAELRRAVMAAGLAWLAQHGGEEAAA